MPEIRPHEREPRDAQSAASGEREHDQGVLRERRGPAPRGASASRRRTERREGRARVGMRGSDSPDEQASAAVRPARESCGVERRGTQCMQRSAVQAAHGMDQVAAPTRNYGSGRCSTDLSDSAVIHRMCLNN